MPHRSKSEGPAQGSRNPSGNPQSTSDPPSHEPGFTESKQFVPEEPRQTSPSEGLDPEATEPFPPDLFRMPVPDRVFSEMPSMSDAALRCLLALIRESFRFDPEASTWMCPERSFSRQEIETATGLSDQGTRNGLESLEKAGLTQVDRSGRSYSYALRMEVPTERYTYVPTTLLEKASDLPSATALRALLAVLRATWGWTSKEQRSGETASQTAQEQTVHQRWAALPTSTLSGLIGCSEPALREAIGALEGEWISRVQPGHGAYLYRVLPGAFEPEEKAASGEENCPKKSSSNPRAANEITPDRQRNYSPSSYKENPFRDKQSREPDSKKASDPQAKPPNFKQGGAVPSSQNESGEEATDTDLSEFSERRQSLYHKLTNAGVWPDRAKECLRRYSPARVKANFELFRERAPEIDDHGAWLCAAITDGYANVSGESRRGGSCQSGSPPPDPSGGRKEPAGRVGGETRASEGHTCLPEHKEKVTARRKEALLRDRPEARPEHFHRFRHAEDPGTKQFLYFDPSVGGPDRRVPGVEAASDAGNETSRSSSHRKPGKSPGPDR